MDKNVLSNLGNYLIEVEDFRIDRTKYYPLEEILFLQISAVLSGAESWEEISDFGKSKLTWLRKYYSYAQGIPSHDTINRVMSNLDHEQFNSCFIKWTKSLKHLPSGSLINIDGKTIKGSKTKGRKTIHLVSAWSSALSLCLGQVKTAEKSNEITAIPELLEQLELSGCIVSIDAMGCQKSIVSKLQEQETDYILGLKGNQGKLEAAVKLSFEKKVCSSTDTWIDKDHGRLETRVCRIIHDLDLLPMAKDWKGLSSLIEIQSTRELLSQNKVEQNTRYYVASLKTDAKQFNRLVRGHWAIENQLHWSLDVIFREDLSRKRQGQAAENFALVRKTVINLLNLEKSKISKNRKQLKAAIDDKFRENILLI